MVVQLFNTDGRTIQEFKPLVPGRVGMYTCGPTVYNFSHIGNLRTYIFEDLLRRALEYAGYDVTHVMNVTDVGHLTDDGDSGEDKIVKSARERGRSVWEIAEMYTAAFFRDIELLGIERPTVVCRATDHIPEMIALAGRLEERGLTYRAGGNLYYDISRFPEYGRMALLDRQELQAGARVEIDANKRNPRDFALWFTSSKFEHQAMQWDSPWGRGYPGWHLECSAMSMKYLGERFDIHCGGVDHIPVHHTNEIAQSEGATGAKWVSYWIHGEFLLLDRAKMARSSGRFVTLSDLAERGVEPADYRYFCLGAHYRSQLQFSDEALEAARNARRGLAERMSRLREEAEPAASEGLSERSRGYLDEFRGAIALDLGSPRALSALWGLLKDSGVRAGEKLAAAFEMNRVLGLDLSEEPAESASEVDQGTLDLVRERERSRKEGDYARADAIRERLRSQGIAVEDTPQGTKWSRVK